MKMPRSLSRTKTTPIPVRRTRRLHDVRALTSLPAGKMVPLVAVPLLREDAVRGGQFRLTFEMQETVELLLNSVNINVKAYLVPWLAFERFNGMDDFNRSYEGLPRLEGDTTVVPFFEEATLDAHGSNEVLTYLGKHVKPGSKYNTAYNEAYNMIWNFRAANRSPDITKRDRLEEGLAPAFWQHQGFAHIVPDFDQATVDGQVPLNVVDGKLPVRGIGQEGTGVYGQGSKAVRDAAGTDTYPYTSYVGAPAPNGFVIRGTAATGGLPDIYAELAENGITVSLSNIELATKTRAFAALRKQYSGHDDDYIIDMLMDGMTIPDQAWKQPILLSERDTVFGMAKRYAADGENLTESVVNGAAQIDLAIRLPRVPTGGVIMIVAEITPEQLFERQKDPFLHALDVDQLPHYLRDELDPEKVSIVTNDYVDIDHDTPNGTFGYAPLNHEWNHAGPTIGGRFYRPEVDAGFDEDRQRIWAVETVNPSLSEDFYLCTTMHEKPFHQSIVDNFDCMTRGAVVIEGNTVFGNLLIEGSDDDFEKVLAEAPMERIEK